ncbi:Exocyst complex component 5 [Auxenochlorella protothecoides]|uniref:Exocyst complex component 5 n=1 Tax=Auxenochlorella protothecoides TaxID=3075 RepID=A0A087SCE1_AUXPR|nr:Exocyst complex component 5 [Auxenochlorella protothecoides]KFM23395.1 Exocyst complex component 5 [Auxenochlorella protothecoides]
MIFVSSRAKPLYVMKKWEEYAPTFEVQRRLGEIQKAANTVCERLEQDTSERQGLLLASLQTVERGHSEAQGLFRDVEAKTATLTQAATRHGNRLKTALLEKQRASAAIRQLNHLLTFAHAPSLSALPALFHDDARAGEAAATATALLAVSREVVEAMRSSHTLKQSAPLGSINAALVRLEEYCNALDNRVVSRFDAALARSDFPAMAACARIMAAGAGKKGDPSGSGERLLIQRYISTRPIFTEPEQGLMGRGPLDAGNPPPPGSPGDASPLRSLRLLYKTLLQNIMNEAVVAEQVFTQPTAALAALVTRVFEQRVQFAVDQALSWRGVPDPPSASDLRAHLRQLAEAVAMTRGLASDAQEVMGGESALMNELADAATAQHLANYVEEELEWLETRFREEEERAPGNPLSLPSFMELLAAHTEALERATTLGLGAGLTATVRTLHGTAADLAAPEGPPCLLRQARALLAAGLAASAGMCEVLGALGTLGAALELLLAHHGARVAPALLPAPADARTAAAGLEALRAELDAEALAALDAALAAELAGLEARLAECQLPADFRPSDADAVPGEGPGERPTPACAQACATLEELMLLAEQCLHGPNRESMQAEVGLRLVDALRRHMARQRFCPLGALCWRRDLQEYRRAARADGPAARQLAEMEAEAGLLVVAPEALPGLVGSTLGLTAQRARQVIALRADWGEAGARGKRLAALFPDDQRR